MDERKHPLAKCEDCPYQEGTAYVPSQFPTRSIKLAVVGEAPGQQEAKLGIPFMGPSGDLLNNVLNHHGIARDEIFVSNICSCRPFGPTEAPPKAAIAACSERLREEIDVSGTDTILAVGGTAAKALVDGSRTITKLRVGPPKPYKHDDRIQVISTWHPAFCLRTPDAFPSFVTDVGKIKSSNLTNWKEPQWGVIDDVEKALIAIDRLIQITDKVAIDIEAGTEKDFDYTHPEDFELLCIGVGYADNKALVFGYNVCHDERFLAAFAELLQDVKIIGQNLKFDLRALSPLMGIKKVWFDTMLSSYSLDERPGQHGLEILSVERLGSPSWKDVIKKYIPRGGSYANIPKPILYQYNAWDVANTWSLFTLFTGLLNENQRRAHDFMVEASNELIHLELAGITFDEAYNKELAEEYSERLDSLEIQINDVVGRPLNPRSPLQITRYFAEKGVIVSTTGAEFLTDLRPRLNHDLVDFVDILLKHRKESKLMGTYVKGLANRTTHGKIFTTYLLHGTTSGRLASRNPNMQNIPRNSTIKNQFTVEHPDNLLVQLDYKQAEGRVITTLAQDEYLRSIFRDPSRDIFDELTTQIYGAGNWGKEERVKIKSIFYGLAFGRGAVSIAKELNITIEESAQLLYEFKSLIPATIKWQRSVTQRVLSGNDLITPFGRKRSFYLITNENRSEVINEALSFLPQSIASDICLSALIRLRPALAGIATLRLTIHDAIIFECHEKDKAKAVEIARAEMIDAGRKFTDYVPFITDVTSGKMWGEL